MPQQLSEAPGEFAVLNRHVPFTVFLSVVPLKDEIRHVEIRDLERTADVIETALDNICGSTISFDYTKPIAFTKQFGNKTARFSIHGHACVRTTFTNTPVGQRTVINAGVFKTGPAASNNSNRTPDSELDVLVSELKADIESATGRDVIRLELGNFIYGSGGSHFPR